MRRVASPSSRPPASVTQGRHTGLFATFSVLLGLTVGLALGEVWVRLAKPKPPVQVVRSNNLHAVGDAPVWEWSTDRQPRACAEAHPERIRIMFLGSSITHGFSIVSAAQTFTVALEERLNAARPTPGFCVMNFAQPGFTSQQKLATGLVEIPRYHPALVLWEGWNEFGNFVLLGNSAYELRFYARRDDGFPGLEGVPDGVNRALFLHSRLYEYLTLRFGEQTTVDEMTPALDRLNRLVALTSANGARLGVYRCPSLDRPFRASVAESMNNIAEDFAKAHDIPVYNLAREMIGEDYMKLRADDCCHYNAEGHRVLAPIFERIVLEILDGKPPSR